MFYFGLDFEMKCYECWICTDISVLQVERVQVEASSELQALNEINRLYQPARVLGKPYVVRKVLVKDISC
jgi:hypothetical protein